MQDENVYNDLILQYIKVAPPLNITEVESQVTTYLNKCKGVTDKKFWYILFDMLVFSENKKKYDNVSEMFMKTFNLLAPSWRKIENKQANNGVNLLKFSTLNNVSEARIKDFIKSVKSDELSRLDFSTTQFDDQKDYQNSIKIINQLLTNIKGESVHILGQLNLIKFLENEKRKEKKDYWELLLNLYQLVGEEKKHENLSLEYIDKFNETTPEFNEKYVAKNPITETKQSFVIPNVIDINEMIKLIEEIKQDLTKDKSIISFNFKDVILIHYGALEELAKFSLNLQTNKIIKLENLHQVIYSSLEIMGVDKNKIRLSLAKY